MDTPKVLKIFKENVGVFSKEVGETKVVMSNPHGQHRTQHERSTNQTSLKALSKKDPEQNQDLSRKKASWDRSRVFFMK